jgi:hypothetical protein
LNSKSIYTLSPIFIDCVSYIHLRLQNAIAVVEDEAAAELAAKVGHEAASRPFDPGTDQRWR